MVPAHRARTRRREMKEFRLGASQHCRETSSSNVCSFSVDFKARARCYPKSAFSCAADTVQSKEIVLGIWMLFQHTALL